MIKEQMTNEKSACAISNFYNRILISEYVENIEYQQITKNHDLVKLYRNSDTSKNNIKITNKKYYAVTDKTLKKLLIRSRTTNGISLCNYFIDLEHVFIKYLHYQCKYHKLDINAEIELLSNTDNIIKYSDSIRKQEFDKKLKEIYKIGYVYFIQEEESKNIKIGYSFNLKERLCQLQVANSQKLTIVKYEKCIFPHIREQHLHKIYKDCHIRGEWFKIDLNI
jgi:hypothetical protein